MRVRYSGTWVGVMTLREQLIADQRARIAQLKEEGLPADSLMVEEADLVRAEAGSDHIMNIERYGDLEVIGMRRLISERTDREFLQSCSLTAGPTFLC